jgi:hypothetical protein
LINPFSDVLTQISNELSQIQKEASITFDPNYQNKMREDSRKLETELTKYTKIASKLTQNRPDCAKFGETEYVRHYKAYLPSVKACQKEVSTWSEALNENYKAIGCDAERGKNVKTEFQQTKLKLDYAIKIFEETTNEVCYKTRLQINEIQKQINDIQNLFSCKTTLSADLKKQIEEQMEKFDLLSVNLKTLEKETHEWKEYV